MVHVDLQPPSAQLHPLEHGRGNMVDHIILRWNATDENLESRPISLFYSSSPQGPWSTIAARLANTGHYFWRLQRHVPAHFYLRLEVRDRAGNRTVVQSPTPVTLQRPQPTGRLRGVRPIRPNIRPTDPLASVPGHHGAAAEGSFGTDLDPR